MGRFANLFDNYQLQQSIISKRALLDEINCVVLGGKGDITSYFVDSAIFKIFMNNDNRKKAPLLLSYPVREGVCWFGIKKYKNGDYLLAARVNSLVCTYRTRVVDIYSSVCSVANWWIEAGVLNQIYYSPEEREEDKEREDYLEMMEYGESILDDLRELGYEDI